MGRSQVFAAFVPTTERDGVALQTRGLAISQRAANSALGAILLSLLDCPEGSGPREILSALDDLVEPFPAPDALKALLARLVGLEIDHPQVSGLGPGVLKQAQGAGLGDALLAMARARPVLLAIDDVHWLDTGSAEWLAGFCHRLFLASPGDRVMVLVTARGVDLPGPLADLAPAGPSPSGGLEGTIVSLGPLGVVAGLDVAAQVLGMKAAAWPAPVRKLAKAVLDRAGGNPSYIVETLHALIETGVLAPAGDSWTIAKEDAESDLPGSIDAAIGARLAALPGRLREQLQLAAVAGPRFDAQLLGKVFKEDLAGSVDELMRLELLARGTGGGVGIPQDQIREQAYAALGDDARRGLHLQVGEALESVLGFDAPKFAADLAHHFGSAGDAPRAFKYQVMLADKARESAMPREARAAYRKALEWAALMPSWDEGVASRRDVLLHLSQAEMQLGNLGEALALLDGITEADQPTPAVFRARGAIHEKKGDLVGAIELVTKARDRSRKDPPELARSIGALANLHRIQGKLDAALELGREAQRLYGGLGLPAEEALACGIVGVCLHRRGDLQGALAEYSRSLELRESCGDLEGAANTHNNLGALHDLLGDPAEAEKHFGWALGTYTKLGHRLGVVLVLNNLGDHYLAQGNFGEAEKRLKQAQALSEQIGYAPGVITTMGNLAQVLLGKGQPGEAVRQLDRSLAYTVRAGHREHLPELHALRARAHHAAVDATAARRDFEEASRLALEAGNAELARKYLAEAEVAALA